jgi:hypothetical protein
MVTDPVTTIRKLAACCGIALDDELLALALERSSIGYMLQYKDRFDDARMRQLSERKCNLPPGSDTSKVRNGGVGGGERDLSPEIAAAIDHCADATLRSELDAEYSRSIRNSEPVEPGHHPLHTIVCSARAKSVEGASFSAGTPWRRCWRDQSMRRGSGRHR